MKNLGVILLVVGILLGIFGFYQSSQDQTLLEVGDIELKKDSLQLNWMIILGGVLLLVGVLLTAMRRN